MLHMLADAADALMLPLVAYDIFVMLMIKSYATLDDLPQQYCTLDTPCRAPCFRHAAAMMPAAAAALARCLIRCHMR